MDVQLPGGARRFHRPQAYIKRLHDSGMLERAAPTPAGIAVTCAALDVPAVMYGEGSVRRFIN